MSAETAEGLHALRDRHLVEPDWLEAHLVAPDLVIVDMRGYVRVQTSPDGIQTAEYTGARDEYEREHIPGAVYLDWTRDIVDLDDRVPAQVAGPQKIARVFGAAGIGDGIRIVAYDNHPASQFATRLWWVARLYGHDNVRVLNGGLACWRSEGRSLTSEVSSPISRVFTPRPRPELRRSAEDVVRLLEDRNVCLVDARDDGQYTGTIRRGPRGGHIPGAVHLPREAFFEPDGRFKTSDELLQIVERIPGPEEKEVIAYCNGGVAATSVLFALSMVGRDRWSNYDGSWNEWGARLELPVEQT